MAAAIAPFCLGSDLGRLALITVVADPTEPSLTASILTQPKSFSKPVAAKKGGKRPPFPRSLLIALASALALVVMAAIVVRIQTRDGTLVLTVDDPEAAVFIDGDAVKVKLGNDGKTYRIAVEPGAHELVVETPDGTKLKVKDNFIIEAGKATRLAAVFERRASPRNSTKNIDSAVAVDPERRAAEWVLSIGGFLHILSEGKITSIAKDGKLPDRPFAVVHAHVAETRIGDADFVHLKNLAHLTSLSAHHFWGNETITDSGIEHLLGLQQLEVLDLCGAAITDVGLERLATLKNLRRLHLGRARISDGGLAHLAGLNNLEHLNVNFTPVTNAGLSHLKGMTSLEILELEATSVTDDGLQHLQGLKLLQSLNLNGTKITGAGLIHLEGLSQLTTLYLDLSPTTDAGLETLKDWTNLNLLGLQGTQITDAGLKNLEGLTGLKKLNLKRTKVNPESVKRLAVMLPNCRIEWDGGVVEPSTVPKASAAPSRRPKFQSGEWSIEGEVLSQTGTKTPALLIFGDTRWTDGDFTCEIWHTKEDVSPTLLVRAVDEGTHIYADFGSWANTWSDLQSVRPGPWTRLKLAPCKIPIEQWVPVKLQLRGKDIIVFAEGKEVSRGEDTTRFSGAIGLRTFGGPAKYRNLRFTDPAGNVLWEGLPELPSE